jgi:hypothetical protein
MSVTMNSSEVVINLPSRVYDDLLALKTGISQTPVDIITELVKEASQHRAWLQDVAKLRAQIRENGGLQVGTSEEQIIENLKQTRNEIFDKDYAHLYR